MRIRYVAGDPAPRTGLRGALARLDGAVARRVAGQHRVWRAVLLAVLAGFTAAHLRDFNHGGIYDGANLILHEAGHLLFQWSGSDMVTALGGTLFNLAVPLLAAVAFWRRGDVFAVPVCLWWAGTVLVTAAPYIADARLMVLPTVTVGEGPARHDWNFILGELGLLPHDRAVAGLARRAGLGLMVVSLAAGARVVALMGRDPETTEGRTPDRDPPL